MRSVVSLTCFGLGLLLSVSVARGQATFQLQNRNPFAGVDAPVFDAQGLPLAGTNYLVELWGGATVDSLRPAADYYYGGGRLIVPFDTRGYFSTFHAGSVSDVPGGSFAWLQLRAWDARLGQTYEDVLALDLGGYGASPVFYALGGNPGSLVPPGPLTGLQSFSLRAVVPEPGSVLLLVLGLPLLLVCLRRRK